MPSVVSHDGTRIHYDVFGPEDGEPLLLLMGLAVDRWGWIRQRADLARRFDTRPDGTPSIPTSARGGARRSTTG